MKFWWFNKLTDLTRNQILVIGTTDNKMNDKLSVRYICVLSSKRGKMLYSRCFDDPHKCGDLVPGRVLTSRYKWGIVIKVVMSGGRWNVQYPTPIRSADEIVRFNISQMQGPGTRRVSSIRYIIGYSCKDVTSEVGKASVFNTNQNGGVCFSNG